MTKKQLEVYSFHCAGLRSAVVPRYVNDVMPSGAWDNYTQIKIRGYIGLLGERFPEAFVQNWQIKQRVPNVHVHGPGLGLDHLIPDTEGFRDSKFTLHIKNEPGNYLCNSVLRSIAARVSISVTSRFVCATVLQSSLDFHRCVFRCPL